MSQLAIRQSISSANKAVPDGMSSKQSHTRIRNIHRHYCQASEFVCVEVLRPGPINPMGSCRARSVYITTRLLGRLSPLSG